MKLIPLNLTIAIMFAAATFCRGQEIGLQLASLNKEMEKDAVSAFAKVKELGISQVEMDGTHGLSFPEFIKLLAANGLSVISFTSDFEKLQRFPQVVADEARMYGAKYVICSWIPHIENGFSKEDVDNAAEVLNQAGKVIARNGLLLCYQPHGYEFQKYNDGTLFDYMVEKLDSRYVHFEMDVFWVKQAGQDPVMLLKKYPSRFILMQLKDRKAGTPLSTNGKVEADTNVVLGSGDVGIKKVVEAARELGIQHFFIEDESPKADKQLPKSIAYVRSLNEKDTAKK